MFYNLKLLSSKWIKLENSIKKLKKKITVKKEKIS